jgi:hypothetical protein
MIYSDEQATPNRGLKSLSAGLETGAQIAGEL